MKKHKYLTGIGLLMAVFLLTACGSDTKETSTSGPIDNSDIISGRVSNGYPIVGAAISSQCGDADEPTLSSQVSSADGTFEVKVNKEDYPCMIIATSQQASLRSIATQSGDYVNINPLTEVVTAVVLAEPSESASSGRKLSRSSASKQTAALITPRKTLDQVDGTFFNAKGQDIVDTVFTGGFDFANDFDKDYTDASAKNGDNLADTLFRSVDATVGGLQDINSIVSKANDPLDTSVSGGFLDDPAFQAVVATEVVAVAGGNDSSTVDTELGTLSAGDAIKATRATVYEFVQTDNNGTPATSAQITKAAR
ncbi:MAG: hypothetical protein RPS47_16610, partial [Colwellia sp.]